MASSRLFKDAWKYGVNFLRSEACILILILTLALFLRIYMLEQVPAGLYVDEIYAVYFPYLNTLGTVVLSPTSIINNLLSGTFFTYSLFGPSTFFTRLPEVVLGTLLVLATYLLAKEMFSKRVGLLSAVLVAVSPWALHFSRFQAFCSAYVFYFTVAMLFLYKGINADNKRRKFIWFCLGSLMLGLTASIHSSASVFIPLFLVGFLIAYVRMKSLKIRPLLTKGVIYAAIFLIAYSPVFLPYLVLDPSGSRSLANSTYSHSQNIFDLLRMFLERAYMHLSPGFLVFTTPATHDLPFQQTISQTGLLTYSPTIFGELNYYGVLLYPGILLLAYKALKKSSKGHAVLLWWIICYSIVSGIAYYDNPSAARNIVGLPALIITIALAIDFLIKVTRNLKTKKIGHVTIYFKPLLSVLLICLIAVPTSLFLHEYYVNYPSESAKVFDYGFEETAQFLTETNNWNRPIFLGSLPNRNWNLAFYSPEQPFKSDRLTSVFPSFNFTAQFQHQQNVFTQVEAKLNLEMGSLEFKAQIDKSYGAATSSQMWLICDEDNMFTLTIYAKNSTYNPNYYLLSQTVNGEVYVKENSLNKTIEYGKLYPARLVFNATTIYLYFDGEPITTWSRLSYGVYNYLRLGCESGQVSFTDLKIESDGYGKSLYVSDWQIISGTWTIDQNVLQGDASVIFIISNALYLQLLQENNVEYTIMKTVRYPEGEIIFWVIMMPP
jgi:4-amino-4-deoxy-L-arabinose transferase-like glycosyltransferase